MTEKDAFDQATGMEDPLRSIRYLASALNRVARALDDEDGMIVYELALSIQARVQELDDIHEYFFRLHHPHRERFEHEGWPTDEADIAADATGDGRETKSRLRQAREEAGYSSASQAAKKFGWVTPEAAEQQGKIAAEGR